MRFAPGAGGDPTRLPRHRFRNNAVRLQPCTLAYHLGNFPRTPPLTDEIEHWSMASLREKLTKIGAKVFAIVVTSPSSLPRSRRR